MAQTPTIQMSSTGDCTQFYRVEYKRDWERDFQLLTPNPTTSTFDIPNLDDNTTYDIRIQARCCNGQWSPMLVTTITTPS